MIKDQDKENHLSFAKRVLSPTLKKYKGRFRKKFSGEKHDKLEMKILQAGSPFDMTPVDFRLVQIILIILFPILFMIYGSLLSISISMIFFLVIFSVVFAAFLPTLYLLQKTKKRSKRALKELPDIVDLLTVSLEAGLGFDLALHKLISRNNGIIADEFHRCLEEIRLGKPRRIALKEITERLPLDEMNVLINSILQAEKLGISTVQILRIQSHEIRQKRKQRAEEQAMKAPIKMLFPLVFFIFPSLFIVLLGPAVIQFINTFKK
ncbi:type II secretion system F family protein [Crassaminicella profunda]|uniref:type II secretion system F family protein n=1 Tax=Crassaminicella profunda TaxID=1286698 RepID=UPI001CA62F35|nr:type II secretion system F family protein [Crassaminicella profunda]QZY55402.1 type II secretion system F family protein [Crassaminicella profunda]